MSARVLITGSRTWVNAAVIRDVLLSVWGDGDAVLVGGACPRGADRIAEMFWTRWGGQVERNPADWASHGRAAGFRRNAAMGCGCLPGVHQGRLVWGQPHRPLSRGSRYPHDAVPGERHHRPHKRSA